MCGIAGVRKFGADPITGEELVVLLCMLEHRGQHATGIALVNPDGIRVMKAPTPAWKFTKDNAFEEFLNTNLKPETLIALLHTRWATGGNPNDNENNHPMWDGATAIVHNGMLTNHSFMFSQGKYTKTCETDSDIIRAIVSEHGFEEKGIRELCRLNGSAAIACVSTKYPDKLLLARSGSPLIFGYSENGDKLYWASEEDAIIKAAKPFKNIRGTWVQDTKSNVCVGSMPDNTAWLFGAEGLERHQLFNTCSYYHKPDYSKGRENYHAKMKNWKRTKTEEAKKAPVVIPFVGQPGIVPFRKPEAEVHTPNSILKDAIVKCPGCGTGIQNNFGRPWIELQCPACKSALG